MFLLKCQNCKHYKPATKPVMGFSGKTGSCLDRAYPYNKVTEEGYCREHEEVKTRK